MANDLARSGSRPWLSGRWGEAELVGWYEQLEMTLPVREAPEYRRLVVPYDNDVRPVHRWFHVKEAYSADLLPAVLEDLGLTRRRRLAILDAFVGSGTTVVSAMDWAASRTSIAMRADGIEMNPFLSLVARCKVSAARRQCEPLARTSRRILEAVKHGSLDPAPVPALSTFSNTAYFRPGVLRELLELKAGILRYANDAPTRALLLLALGGIVERSSRLRRDGRALRFERNKEPQSPHRLFEETIANFLADLQIVSKVGEAHVHVGDGRRPTTIVPGAQYQLALFSPPYINNIDYTEIYKLEAWLLGLVSDHTQFREQRRATMRSHPSVRFGSHLPGRHAVGEAAFDELLAPVLAAIPDTSDRTWRRRLIVEYFDDIASVLVEHRSLLERGSSRSFLACVIGNSVHGGHGAQFVVAADLLMARLGELAGYDPIQVGIARRSTRFGRLSPFARESIVMMRPFAA